jgi:hypothetical protein
VKIIFKYLFDIKIFFIISPIFRPRQILFLQLQENSPPLVQHLFHECRCIERER